jgi:uncharacterized membrane protein (Fun14 family)
MVEESTMAVETGAPEAAASAMPESVANQMPIEQASGMVDKMKEQFSVDNLMNKVRSSKDQLFEIGLYAGVGFLSGFLLKKYSSYVAVFILMLVGLGVLQNLEVINIGIDWAKVNELFGIQAAQNVSADSLIHTVWEWVKVNLAISISYLIGLFIGLKVG